MAYFVTSNMQKFKEAQLIVPELEHLQVDLPEIQELNPKVVVAAKLEEAAKLYPDYELVVEDTSLSLDALNSFPGPLIKWLMQAVGVKGIYDLSQHLQNRLASARTMVGYKRPGCDPIFFEGVINGQIVEPRGETDFDWDLIFLPDGFSVTFAEMSTDEKSTFSMRTEALNKLKMYLSRNK